MLAFGSSGLGEFSHSLCHGFAPRPGDAVTAYFEAETVPGRFRGVYSGLLRASHAAGAAADRVYFSQNVDNADVV